MSTSGLVTGSLNTACSCSVDGKILKLQKLLLNCPSRREKYSMNIQYDLIQDSARSFFHVLFDNQSLGWISRHLIV